MFNAFERAVAFRYLRARKGERFVSIIGIPFGLQDLKLAGLSLAPVGKRVVMVELADAARAAGARDQLDRLRQG